MRLNRFFSSALFSLVSSLSGCSEDYSQRITPNVRVQCERVYDRCDDNIKRGEVTKTEFIDTCVRMFYRNPRDEAACRILDEKWEELKLFGDDKKSSQRGLEAFCEATFTVAQSGTSTKPIYSERKTISYLVYSLFTTKEDENLAESVQKFLPKFNKSQQLDPNSFAIHVDGGVYDGYLIFFVDRDYGIQGMYLRECCGEKCSNKNTINGTVPVWGSINGKIFEKAALMQDQEMFKRYFYPTDIFRLFLRSSYITK